MNTQIREFADADMPAALRLLNDAHRGSYEFSPFTEENIHFQIQERKAEILVAEGKDEVLGVVAYRDGHWGEEILWLATSATPNQTLVADGLVAEAEKYVKRGELFTSIDAGSPEAEEWAARGYRLDDGLYQMLIALDAAIPLPKVPDGILVRSLRTDEERELIEVVNAVFGWERLKSGVIEEWKADFPPFDEEWVHVVESGGRLVSAVASRPDTNHNKLFGTNRGNLGPAVTLPEFRGKHLASILTRRATNLLFQKGMDSAVLYTRDQNVPSVTLLQKLGFRIGHHWRFMRKNFPTKHDRETSEQSAKLKC
jgi:ribosomal protein S18 acetylase RimI-like enzyme